MTIVDAQLFVLLNSLVGMFWLIFVGRFEPRLMISPFAHTNRFRLISKSVSLCARQICQMSKCFLKKEKKRPNILCLEQKKWPCSPACGARQLQELDQKVGERKREKTALAQHNNNNAVQISKINDIYDLCVLSRPPESCTDVWMCTEIQARHSPTNKSIFHLSVECASALILTFRQLV